MLKSVLTKAELAKRWNVDIRTIDKWEQEKVIQRIQGIPAPRYSIEHVESIEGLKNKNIFSPLERQKLEKELINIKLENQKLKAVLGNILSESAKITELMIGG